MTHFFRDREAFDALEHAALPSLLQSRPSDAPVRVWVAGCGTGEDAYGVAILLREQMAYHQCTADIQLFATEADKKSIAAARAGLYHASSVQHIEPARLQACFTEEQHQYRVVKPIRDMLRFAPHNLLRDPPFARLDLLCCRKLLMGLDRDAQRQALETFRYALKPGGYLFLGATDSAETPDGLFTVIDKKHRIYQANAKAPAPRRGLPTVGLARNYRAGASRQDVQVEPSSTAFSRLHRKCIDQVMAPSVLVDAKFNVLHLSERVGRYLLPGAGHPSLQLLDNVAPEMRVELQAALLQASQSGAPATTRPITVRRGDAEVTVEACVRYFVADESGLLLVMFQDVAANALATSQTSQADPGNAVSQLVVNRLGQEIRHLQEDLQQTVDRSHAFAEELHAANDELQAFNDELRSANAELEIGTEVLQSSNEELAETNSALKCKVDGTRQLNRELLSLISSADIAALFIDNQLRIRHYTPQAATIFRLIPTDVSRLLRDITHTLDYHTLAADVDAVLRSVCMVERQVSSIDGMRYLAHARPYRSVGAAKSANATIFVESVATADTSGTAGSVDGVVLTFVDVTALCNAKERIHRDEDRLRVAAETTVDYAIFTIDDSGLLSGWNQGARRMFGYEELEILGKPFALLFPPEDRAAGAAEAELFKARHEGRTADDRWHVRKDGSRFFASGVVAPLALPSGGYAKIARDLTESMQLQASRDEMLRLEKQSNEAKDQFLAVMSHELKHPLNLIQVNTELLISQPEVRALASAARAGDTIRLAVASQTKIIDDLLDLSRARTGKLNLRLDPTDLQEITSAIATAASDSAQRKGLTLDYLCSDSHVFVLCDRVRTEQVLWNLINNAIKFTPEGGSIVVQLSLEPDFARFSVTDDGQGIAPQFLPQIFGLFVQAPNQSPSSNTGFGVGLTLVRDLIAAQGGKVLADSPGLGQGATFTVWLPLATTPPRDKPDEVAAGNLKNLRILAVDDMADLLEPFAALLRLEGAEVDTALGGQEALDQLALKSYDLMISDVGMPLMDGYDLIRNIRKTPALAPLKSIALSGYGRQVDAVRALQSGFDAHLAKPATIAHICQTIAQLLANTR